MRHKDPTVATAKQLFGMATHCGYPNCNETLYRSAAIEGTGPLLNCRIAHICAASQGGPRWDPEITEEVNRSFDNLLLLCIPHAAEIDTRVLDYPVKLLKNWKRAQIVPLDRGVSITDDQAVEAIAESHTEISIQGGVLNFGGQGGNAVGAAGGGGAAIGSGAIGGGGGAAADRIEIDGLPGGEFGAGGGGGGMVAPRLREPRDSTNLVGEGFSDGFDGQSGGTTSFGAFVVAPGGAPGLAGNPNRSTTQALALSSLMAVNSVEIRDGLAFVLAGPS